MPTLWSMGKDTVIDSLLDHRNEGEVMPPKEGLSAQDQLIQHISRKDTIFPKMPYAQDRLLCVI